MLVVPYRVNIYTIILWYWRRMQFFRISVLLWNLPVSPLWMYEWETFNIFDQIQHRKNKYFRSYPSLKTDDTKRLVKRVLSQAASEYGSESRWKLWFESFFPTVTSFLSVVLLFCCFSKLETTWGCFFIYALTSLFCDEWWVEILLGGSFDNFGILWF